MRIALFAPIPPTRSGIAAYYTAALLPWLARQHDVDLFTAERPRRDDALPAGAAHVFSAHEFLWRRAREPYDLVIYQLGNSIALNYMWPYLVRYPGLVVIHDGNPHAARAFHFLSRDDADGYRAEFAFNDRYVDDGDPLTAERLNGAACVASRADPVAVAVDIHDEERKLLIAMRALARDPDLRRRLGVAARAWWADHFRMEHAVEDYERVMTATVTRTAARRAVPPHLDHDGGRRARDILSPFGLLPDFLRRE